MTDELAGTRLLVRLALRRDRLLASVSIGALVLLCYASAAATAGLYGDEAERVRAAEAINRSPAIVALYGPILDVRSEGELAMTKMTVLYAVFVAALFIVLLRRHTRVEEEAGRTELVGAGAVGRSAPLAAAALEAVALAALLGVLVAAANTAGGLDAAGSVAFGAVWAGTALVAAGVAAVAAQLSASARTCGAAAAGAVGAFFVVRAVGDTGPAWLSWCPPLGWNTQTRAYGDPRWWVLVLHPLLAAALLVVAAALQRRRDLGSGILSARPGPAHGSPRLADAITLAIQVHGAAVVLWTVAVGVLGVAFGMIAPGVGDLLDSGTAKELIDKLGGLLVAAVLSMIAVVVSYFAVSVVARAGSDEGSGRTELVLATATSRSRWLLATLLVALLGAAWLLLVTGFGLEIGYVAASGPDIGDLVVAALAWVPAVWVVAGLATLGFALRPGWTVAGWAWPALFLVLTLVAELLELPSWVGDLSPYSHVPQVPAERWDWGAETGLLGVAAVLVAVAWWRFRGRDIG
ncbi:ABC transporter permease [Nocardioides sp. MH1]|uniref:ABC transporter permease n=1 Tax=Nocardioides sp. MH1 TaxID=3242490 RepID=UPI0035211AEB